MSLMTPLNRVLGLGTGKGAAEHWWLQRVTAVALLPLGLWFAYELLALPGFDYASVVGVGAAARHEHPADLARRRRRLSLLARRASRHRGLRDGQGSRVAALMASTLAQSALTIAAMFAVLKIAFGS